jgi:S1-C subfamily serine protease
VIKDANELCEFKHKKVYKARLIGTDSKMDIALLKVMLTATVFKLR